LDIRRFTGLDTLVARLVSIKGILWTYENVSVTTRDWVNMVSAWTRKLVLYKTLFEWTTLMQAVFPFVRVIEELVAPTFD